MAEIGHNGGPPIDWRRYGGYVPEARDSRQHPIVGYGKPVKPADDARGFCYSVNEAWRDLLHECRFADGFVVNAGRKMQVKRGELVGAISWLAFRWNWTPKTVRGFLDRIEADGMISRFVRNPDGSIEPTSKGNQKGNQGAIISVCNYVAFNFCGDSDGHSSWQSAGNQGAIEGQSKGNIDKNGKREEGNLSVEDIEKVAAALAERLKAPVADATPPPAPVAAPVDDAADLTAADKPYDREKPEGAGLPVVAATELPDVDPFEAFRLWNELALRCGLQQARTLTPSRRKSMAARIREHGGMEAWHRALAMIERSAFLRGRNDRGWRADLDFLLQARSFAKVVDGAYGNGAHAPPPKPTNIGFEMAQRIARGEPEFSDDHDDRYLTLDLKALS